MSNCRRPPIETTPEIVPPTLAPFPTASATSTPNVTPMPAASATPIPLVPNFSHVVIIIFENKEFGSVIGNRNMPYFNLLADTYALLAQHYAPTHPSLPNYLSLIGGDTFNVADNCGSSDCYINAPSLPDLIEASGRTWKTYQDDMPEPCFTGDTLRYVRKHNPFIFFDAIRLNEERCRRSVVPLAQLDADLAANDLPNFIFITPDICYSAHDCALDLADNWMKEQIEKIYPALDATGEPFLIILTWDEGQGDHSCCGLPESAGGRVATILISPQARPNFQDHTPYSHYSILKTISEAWGLPYLGHAADKETTLITAPWR
ncbi:MAG: alkaline phosphatase family protein [Anaerolineales bacterium]|nr:alkaline phosphatase family protein [Anaerolineales bacterium]